MRGLARRLPRSWRAVAVALAATLLLGAPLPARAQETGVALITGTLQRAMDDPGAALGQLRQQIAAARSAGDRDRLFWGHLALADLLAETDDRAAAHQAAQAARGWLPNTLVSPRERPWLDFYLRYTAVGPFVPAEHRQAQAQAREAARAAGDEALLCRLDLLDAVRHVELDDADEAWAALEAVERCGAKLGDAALQAYALGTMAPLAVRIAPQLRPEGYVERALQVLGEQPARHQRAWLLDDLGWALVNGGRAARARVHFERVLALATAIANPSFTMRGHEGLAEVALREGDTAAALRHARAALRVADEQPALRFRRVTAQTQVVEALAQTLAEGGAAARSALAEAIERLRALEHAQPSSRNTELVARSAARGLHALGRDAEAYAELERYVAQMLGAQRAMREREAQRLQARYESARRDAENAALRQAAELARLELEAREQRQRALLAALAALALLLAGGGGYFARALARRRRLAELALRDELTGLPNRRAVLAFAREQLALATRLDLPITLALVDLDRFKDINDRHGHAVGDRVLEAFAAAAQRVVRGQDRVGRYGGEEWLLVMPGTHVGELPALFGRLREALAEQPVEGLPVPHRVTFSMGAAERVPGQGLDTLEALIAEADRQLYRAKASGRDALCGPALPGGAAADVLPNAA